VGLAVSAGGNALYAVNSDFDLQWNGGTLQSYDLFLIRRDTAALIATNLNGGVPNSLAGPPFNIEFVNPPANTNCLTAPQVLTANGTQRVPLGQICAPPVQSTKYVRSSTIIGAFATDLQLQTFDGVVGTRLFAPIRGNATVTWSDVGPDFEADGKTPKTPPEGMTPASFPPFVLTCPTNGEDLTGPVFPPTDGPAIGCTGMTGNTVDQEDTRGVTMPGEPFGLAQSQDGTALAVTHQTSSDTSLLKANSPGVAPSMQFVETDVANGGSGIAFVPHDPQSSVPPCGTEATIAAAVADAGMIPDGGVFPDGSTETPAPGMRCVRPAFLETNHDTAEVDLLRYYSDLGSSQMRPFLVKEATFAIPTNLGGTDSRGIALDPTPRLACMGEPGFDPTVCADLPARVFIANRTPPSIIIGEIGGTSSNGDGSYNPDMLTFTGNVPLPPGPSRVYVAPIVNAQGLYEVRVFVVNFDSSTISVYDPNKTNLALVDTISVGPGPFAMAFDPFDLRQVAMNKHVPADPRPHPPNPDLYRFAYVASFTQSFVQVIDLDQRQPTFENVVFTLGNPTPPKGSQ
jgi:hypothetical protein